MHIRFRLGTHTSSDCEKTTLNCGSGFDQCPHCRPSSILVVTTTGIWPSIPCLRCFALGAFPLTLVPPCWMHSVLFVEGQEVLSVFAEFIAPVSPFFTPSRPLSYFTGCACFWRGCFWFGFLFGALFAFLLCRNLICNSLSTRLR